MGKNRVLFSGGFSCAVVWFFHCQVLWNHTKLITDVISRMSSFVDGIDLVEPVRSA
jgi:hypothetical protein